MSKTALVVCDALEIEVNAAQKKAGTEYEVILIDSRLHIKPELLKAEIEKSLAELKKKNVELVLLALGLCGNCLHELKTPIKLVVPKVDDCCTMFLHTDEIGYLNLKETGHMYMTKGMLKLIGNVDPNLGMTYEKMIEKFGEKKTKRIYQIMYKGYTSFDMIDTGIYPLSEIEEESKIHADRAECSLNTVEGSNIVLENLLCGNWDKQCLIFDANETIKMFDFLPVFN
jgi:hypothetical protein